MRHSKILSICLIMIALYGSGCKKESPQAAEKSNESATTAQVKDVKVDEEKAKAEEFLSDANAAVAKFEDIKISKLNFSNINKPSFIRRMERANKEDVKQAKLKIANQQFKILFGERPERDFYLYDMKKKFGPYWWGSWSLHSYHKIGDKFYEFMLVENGKKIAGRPYKGELGVIKIGKGGRELEKAEFKGSVYQAGDAGAPIGIIKEGWPDAVSECQIPVGDYTAYNMGVTYDNLSITVSNNYHTNAQGKKSLDDIVYDMKVRKDEPFVLDFSNKPMVVFDQPSINNNSFSRGEEIKFAAVLIDPELDIMIRRLNDTSVQVGKKTPGNYSYRKPKSLDPKVVITRADGGIVAEGVMPFG
jgi:hypothetical protein